MSDAKPIAPTTAAAREEKRALEQMVYHAVMEFSPWPMAEVEGKAHLVQAINPAFCALLEKTQEEVIGKPLSQLFSEDHATHTLLERVLTSGEAATHVESASNTHGPIYWSYTCWPVQAKDARHVGLMIQVTETNKADQQTKDINEALLISSVEQHELTEVAEQLNVRLMKEIAERNKAEEALLGIDERLRVALEAADLGTWSFDPATGRFTVDQRYQTIFSLTLSDITLEQGMDAIHPDDRERVYRTLEEAMRLGTDASIETEYRVTHPDGSVHWVISKGRMIFRNVGAAPTLHGFAGTVADITDRKHLELALEQTAKELAEIDRHKSEFLATLAHELRNPLAPLVSGVEILSLPNCDKETAERMHAMMGRQLQHMVRLIDDLMDLSRVSRGVMDLQEERMDLRTVLAEAVETVRSRYDAKGHTLVVQLPEHPLEAEGDANRLNQVFDNLLTNAAKFTDPGGTITLSAAEVGEEIVVIVEDNGIGIAEEQGAAVFDMFAQVDRSKQRAQGGLGIGLNIVKHMVQLHGGRIEMFSAGLGAGTRFTVFLPGVAALATTSTIATPDRTATPQAFVPQRILIVDDNQDAANLLSHMLSKAGHVTQVAYSGTQALELGAGMLPTVVLMDIGMPGMDGNATCRSMRLTPWGKTAFIAALTGWGNMEDRRDTELAGFDHHLVKPVGRADLMALLETVGASIAR